MLGIDISATWPRFLESPRMNLEQSILYPPRSNDSMFDTLSVETSQRNLREVVPSLVSRARPRLAESVLPFTIGVVSTEAQLLRVQALRATAYGHHLPGMAATFARPDPVDLQDDIILFYAEDKQSGALVGSARIQINRRNPLQIERSLELPSHLAGQLLSETTRMIVLPGYNHPVRLALVKACQLYSTAMQISGALAGARHSLLRQYKALGFRDLWNDERMVPLMHGGGLPHRILFRDLVVAESESRLNNQPYYNFLFTIYHPDIRVFETLPGRLAATYDSEYEARAA